MLSHRVFEIDYYTRLNSSWKKRMKSTSTMPKEYYSFFRMLN